VSVKVMAWVWEHSHSRLSARLVLLAIADHANGDGIDAFPSNPQLMMKTGLSERAVRCAVAELVDLGELHVSVGGGRGNPNRYRVLMPDRSAEAPAAQSNPADIAPYVDGNPADKTPYSVNPAELTPYSTQETGQNPSTNPAESAPGTKRQPRATTKHSPSGSAAPAPARTRTRTRGTRIPPGFALDEDMRAWAYADATQARSSPPDPTAFMDWLDRHTEQFRDHWTGKDGSNAVKLDWTATWRNWIRKEIDLIAQRAAQPGTAIARYGGPNTHKSSTTDQRVAAGLALAEQLEANPDLAQLEAPR